MECERHGDGDSSWKEGVYHWKEGFLKFVGDSPRNMELDGAGSLAEGGAGVPTPNLSMNQGVRMPYVPTPLPPIPPVAQPSAPGPHCTAPGRACPTSAGGWSASAWPSRGAAVRADATAGYGWRQGPVPRPCSGRARLPRLWRARGAPHQGAGSPDARAEPWPCGHAVRALNSRSIS